MNARRPRGQRRVLVVAVAALLSWPTAISAQARGTDFLSRSPMMSFGIRGGYARAQAGSDLFDYARKTFTLDTNDFASFAWGATVAVGITENLDVELGGGVARSSTRSEFRHWVGLDDLPIDQTTMFLRVPVTISLKWYFKDRGRSVGQFIWVPQRWAPYAGGGGGALWYRFEQEGNFLDFQTLDVFSGTFETKGTTGTAHAFLGVDVLLSSKVVLTAEGRSSWGTTHLGDEGRSSWGTTPRGRDFVDFADLDLSGFQATLGLSFRF